MAITAADIKFYLSGGAANSDPNASLGGIISTTEIVAATLNNLFDDVSGDESASGDTEYRGFYVKNEHGSLTWQNVVIWIQTETPSADTSVDLALAGEGVNVTMETIADESTAPVGESFTHITTKGTGLSMSNIAFGEFYGVWIKRIVTAAAAAANNDNAILRVEGETAA